MKRRSFLKSGSAFSLPMLLGGVNLGYVANSPLTPLLEQDNDRIFVLIQQNGGNDGLNTVIPIDQYSALSTLRSDILIPESRILKLTDETGVHPSMTGIKSLYEESSIRILQNVGYANQNRSHFRSKDIWTSGSQADEVLTTGWLGRQMDAIHMGFPEAYPNESYPHPLAITLGPSVSETCQGIAGNFSLAVQDPNNFITVPGITDEELPDLPYGHELSYLRLIIEQTNVFGDILKESAAKGQNRSDLYPQSGQNKLADQLKVVAQLISGGLQTKIYLVNLNGFDTHANQVDANDTTTGDHAQLMHNMSEAIHAFMDDLRIQKLDERVIGATRSEFGRQIASNGSLGTDHGDAAPLIVFGTCVNEGIEGSNPEIPSQPEPQSGVETQIDFKDVFGSILIDWFGSTEADVRAIFSHDFEYMPIITPCNDTTPINDLANEQLISFKTSPNPFFEHIDLSVKSHGAHIRISIFNSMGQEVIMLEDRFFPPGVTDVHHELPSLPPGNYYCRMQSKSFQQAVPLVHF